MSSIIVAMCCFWSQEAKAPAPPRVITDPRAALMAWRTGTEKTRVLECDIKYREFTPEGKAIGTEPGTGHLRLAKDMSSAFFELQGRSQSKWELNDEGQLRATKDGVPANPSTLPPSARRRERLWIGPMPAWVFAVESPDDMQERFKIPTVRSDETTTTFYLYPQESIDERQCRRLEVSIDRQTHLPTQIHVIGLDGSHLFLLLENARQETESANTDRSDLLR